MGTTTIANYSVHSPARLHGLQIGAPPVFHLPRYTGIRQGQGRTTEMKVHGMSAAMAVTLKVCTNPALAAFPYWHIDLNSGCGFNHDARCFGSPLAFLAAVSNARKANYRAFFCDIQQDAFWS